MERCEDCGLQGPRVSLGGASLCDRCADRRIARLTGFPELPEPPAPFHVTGPDGRAHVMETRRCRSPHRDRRGSRGGRRPPGEGFLFAEVGAHDAEVGMLVALVRSRAEREIARQHIELAAHRPGWIVREDTDTIVGRLIWSGESSDGSPYNVVVDGHTLTWYELGRALEPYEGLAVHPGPR